ncbi:ACP S-malonyltransferase [Salipaludibacillus agaradhaerens]|uniref:Malonyl CoA-acyl carrier protein transacylase n=1 Tax=Salipaludibacillus agaradhaerens TaxID=76935 RepID=A0A9Q4FYR0_SALAG|nr:ACP S-malonyltransferase [Salipaludibacillus agaradhaerens]MCR6096003.1 ACP S-malonyltransferase [Salipaludibacillus agaradhaerens]MCR6114438.1 ACP S-malonyltransferase [Salipaludibacillus agaradhaerens]
MTKVALLFPGQGAQHIGMGKELAEAFTECKAIFTEADEALEENFSDLIFNGNEEELKRTENTQPALLTTSIAIWEILKGKGLAADYAAGHSLGEYSALTATGAISFKEAVQAVRQRGQLMEEAVPAGKGTMAAILGLDREVLKEVVSQAALEGGQVQAANFNCPGQIVISGTTEGVERAVTLAKEAGAKRAMVLSVSGPFHSELMKSAAGKMAVVLDNITFEKPLVPVISNVTAKPYLSADEIPTALVEQIYSPVMWEDTIKYLVDQGVDTFIEAGPGKVLSGLVKKISRRLTVLPVYDQASLDKAISTLDEKGD